MFNSPIGFFNSAVPAGSLARPNSVVDTPGAGSITNSASAYDASGLTYADFVGHTAIPGPSTTYSVYSFAAGQFASPGQAVYVKYACVYGSNDYGEIWVSIDGGVSYTNTWSFRLVPYSPSTPGTTLALSLPTGLSFGSVKVKITTLYGFANPTEVFIYDIYIQ